MRETYVNNRDTVQRDATLDLERTETGKPTAPKVQGLLQAKVRQGVLSPKIIANLHRIARIAINDAVKWTLVERNDAVLTDAPRRVSIE